jgi:4-hydroxy-tetrahydrodipicolinate synthase
MNGIFAAVPTPLDDRDHVDAPALRRVVRHLLSGGINGLWVLGSGGEFAALRDQDRREAISTVVEEAGGRVPVIAGTGASGSALACAAAIDAVECCADAVFAIAPYFYACNDAELLTHFRTIADASGLPVILYNNPHNTRVNLSLDLVGALAGDPRFAGMKDSSTDWDYFGRLLRAVPRDGSFRVLQGDEMALASSLLMGADGGVLALPVLAPALCVRLYEAAVAGDVASARELQTTLIGLLRVYSGYGRSVDSAFLSGQKGALELLGLCSRRVSGPFRAADEGEMMNIAAILRRYRLLPGSDEKRSA